MFVLQKERQREIFANFNRVMHELDLTEGWGIAFWRAKEEVRGNTETPWKVGGACRPSP